MNGQRRPPGGRGSRARVIIIIYNCHVPRPARRPRGAYGPTRDLLNSKTENGGAGGRLRYSIVLRRLILSSVITRMGEIRKKSFCTVYLEPI